MARLRNTLFAAAFTVTGLVAGFGLAACGLGRDNGGDGSGIADPVVAATVNGRPIYIEDVRSHAVARGILQEGEDLDANSDAFYFALEELIQVRLFAMEAEARGLDREAPIRRQLENARERVLANAIYEEIDERATNPATIERLYRENAPRLSQGREVHLRDIQFATREAADAAKRRLDNGERFEALAFELSTDRTTAADGGDLGWGLLSDLRPVFREQAENASVGSVVGPFQFEQTWHLIRLEDIREHGQQSLEELRPRIIQWLRFQEISQLNERLERDARIERLREPDTSMEPSGEVTAPGDAEETTPTTTQRPAPTPDATAPPGQTPPPFPFPTGRPAQQQAPRPQQQQAPPPAPVQQTTTSTATTSGTP
ncbi:peptidylprolyl isomerase [Terricaulis sp.]|uniref:peptidylprolyl isomerase n=1 Tax=Terricaulis sp. TaxID=2768686 RepID=UPI003782E073